MKIVILNKSNLSVMTYYDAAAPAQSNYGGPWGDPEQTVHVAIPAEVDYRAAEYAWDNGSVVVTENAEIKADIDEQDIVRATEKAVADAIIFGQKIITEFAAENVRLGITQDGQTGVVLDKMASVLTALQTGSLYEAIDRAQAIDPGQYDPKYVTAARLLTFINKIEAYLGLQLSQ
jgi:hypothetical protein